ncbi:MAG: NAD(P)/FAD-dependent oxidoreductase [Gammaproteobacteria bacterium]
MIRITELSLPWGDPTETRTQDALRRAILKRLALREQDLEGFTVYKRSHDARRKDREIAFVYIVDVAVRDEARVLAALRDDRHVMAAPDTAFHPPPAAPAATPERPLVVGFGPCGLFAALVLAQQGYRPIVLERGRDVRRRTQDTWGLWRKRTLMPESNVQFGEGGAGLFSDGKLYSQIKDPRHLGRQVMREFVRAGAPPEIMWVNKPHIGTFRLTGVVARMREEIIAAGGEVRFESKVVDLLIDRVDGTSIDAGKGAIGEVRGVRLDDGTVIASRHVVLALGHSSRDTFRMLERRKVFMEAKPFAIGFRIEHPQSLIDRARLGRFAGHPAIGAADYKLVHHAANGRSVYSFCMCPGGRVVAAPSEPQRVVTNGMSQYSRNERNANAGIVVGIDPERDFPGGPLAGIALQERLESLAFEMGGGDYSAPAQLVGDFIAGRASTALGEVQPSYTPGITLTDLAPLLPPDAVAAMREALPVFGRQIRGFDRDDAVLTGIETRTSSPLRITRDPTTLQSLNVRGLYPGGEGAGYAGGILSAGVDGIKLAEAVAMDISGLPARRDCA